MSKKILVTGGAGFIGSNLTDAFIEKGYEVRIIDNLTAGKKENLNPAAEFHQLDIRDLEAINPIFQGIDYVFHLAAQPRIQPSIQDPITSASINIGGTLNVLVAARDAGVKKVIYSASSSAYGVQDEMPLRETMTVYPKNPYALQKYVGELQCRMFSELYGLPTVSLRYFNVYGPRQTTEGAYATVIGIFLRQKEAGEPLTIVGDGEKRRDFTFVNDIVRGNLLAMESEAASGEVINLGRGKNYSINEVARLIGGQTVNIPLRPGEAKETLADIIKAKQLLGWEPQVNLEEGLEIIKKYNQDLFRRV